MDKWMDKFTERVSGISYVLALLWRLESRSEQARVLAFEKFKWGLSD